MICINFYPESKLICLVFLIFSPQNCVAIGQEFGWQNWLFPIIADKLDVKYAGTFNCTPFIMIETLVDQSHQIFDSVITILKIVILHRLQWDKDGWMLLDHTLSLLGPFTQRGVLDVISVTSSLLRSIVTSIKEEITAYNNNTNASVASNIVALIQGKGPDKNPVFLVSSIFSIYAHCVSQI